MDDNRFVDIHERINEYADAPKHLLMGFATGYFPSNNLGEVHGFEEIILIANYKIEPTNTRKRSSFGKKFCYSHFFGSS